MPADAIRVLTVCQGNTCRSPMAAALVARVAAERGVNVEVSSAGSAAATGMPAADHAIAVMGDSPEMKAHLSRRITDVKGPFDVVLVLAQRAERHAHDLVSRTGAGRVVVRLVDDPFGETRRDYELCRDRMAAVIAKLFDDGEIRAR